MDLRKAKLFLSFKIRRVIDFLKMIFLYVKIFFSKIKGAWKILTLTEKRIIIFCIMILVFGFIFMARNDYLKNTKEAPIVGGKIMIAEIGEPKLINPIFAQTNADKDLSVLMFSGLFAWNEKKELIPDLVKKWETSADKKTYTFYLQPKNEWHDGVPLTSDDIIFTCSLISDPNYYGPLKGLFENVIFEKVDDTTLRFVLQDPYSPFLSNLTFGILPYHLLGNVAVDQLEQDPFNLQPVGAGPYKFKNSNLTKNKKQILLERNEKKIARRGLISEIYINFYPDFEKTFGAYKKGEVSVLTNIPEDKIEEVKKVKDLELYRQTTSSYLVLFFNQSNQFLQTKSFREAIASGIDKKEIVEKGTFSQGKIIEGPILPKDLGFTDQARVIQYSPETAISIFKNLGYQDKDADGVLEGKRGKLEFNLVTTDDPGLVRISDLIEAQLAKVNIKINVISVDAQIVQTDYIFPRKFDLLLVGENLGPDPDPYPFWHSSQISADKLNLSGFSSKVIDELLEEARITDDVNLRENNYQKFHQIIAEEVPAVFLFRPSDYLGANISIMGIKSGKVVTLSDQFFQINKWYTKTGRVKK